MQRSGLRIYGGLLLTGMLMVLGLRFGVHLTAKPQALGHYVLTDLGVLDPKRPAVQTTVSTPVVWLRGSNILYPLKSVVQKTGPRPGSVLKVHNRRGQALGWNTLSGGNSLHAILIDHGKSRDLGTLGGKMSYAAAINDAVQVAGYSLRTDHNLHAFLWQDGSMLDLGTLGGSNSWAWDIDPWGRVVGEADTSSGIAHAFVYDQGVLTDLGTLGGEVSAARGINDRGQIVGEADTVRGEMHAFVYSSGVMGDLNGQTDMPQGWVLTSAMQIDDAGHIRGEGIYRSAIHSFLLTPVS